MKDGETVDLEVLRTRDGFVFSGPPRAPEGEVRASHCKPVECRITSLAGLFNIMSSCNRPQFREAREWYSSPGIHVA